MGGCATKPKVLKSDEGEVPVPAPAPEPVKEVVVIEEGDEKKEGDVGVVVDREAGKVEEIVVEGNKDTAAATPVAAGDDQESKPRSLSNLFKSEEEKDSTVVEVATTELVIGEIKATEKPKEKSEAKEPAAEQRETLVEQPTSPAFVDAPEKAIAEKEPEAKQAAETEIKESVEKKTEEAK